MQNQNAMFWTKSLICILAMFFAFCMMIFLMEVKRDETEKIVKVVFAWFNTEKPAPVSHNESITIVNQTTVTTTAKPAAFKLKSPVLPPAPQPRFLIIRSNLMQTEKKPILPLNPLLNDIFREKTFDSDLKKISPMQFNPFSNDLFAPKKSYNSESKSILPTNLFQNQIIIKSHLLKPKTLPKIEKLNNIIPELEKPTHIRCVLCMRRTPLGENVECPHKNSPFLNRLLSIIRPIILANTQRENKVKHKQRHHVHHHKKDDCSCNVWSEEVDKTFKSKKYEDANDKYETFQAGRLQNNKLANEVNDQCDCSFCQDSLNFVESSEPHHHKHHANQKQKNYRSNSWSRRNFSF